MNELNEVLYWAVKFLQWWLMGFFLRMLYVAKNNGQIKVSDLTEALAIGIVGPFLLVIYVVWKSIEALNKLNTAVQSHRDKVLWRSKRKKTEHILYGDKDGKDSTD